MSTSFIILIKSKLDINNPTALVDGGNADMLEFGKWSSVNSIFSTTNMSSSTLYVGKLLTEKYDGTTA